MNSLKEAVKSMTIIRTCIERDHEQDLTSIVLGGGDLLGLQEYAEVGMAGKY